jgi:hypothetical protein
MKILYLGLIAFCPKSPIVVSLTGFTVLLEKHFGIGIIPPHGYRPEQTQSIKALHWLKYISKRYDVNIQHAFNGGEKHRTV